MLIQEKHFFFFHIQYFSHSFRVECLRFKDSLNISRSSYIHMNALKACSKLGGDVKLSEAFPSDDSRIF